MIAPWALLVVGVAATGLAVNVLYPLRSPGSIAIASFFAGWLVGELAVYAFVGQLAVIAALVGLGALAAWTGLVGLVLSTAASGLLLIGHSRARSAHRAVTAALADVPVASAMDGSSPSRRVREKDRVSPPRGHRPAPRRPQGSRAHGARARARLRSWGRVDHRSS